MKNSIKILLALLVITAFSACKKCYECEKIEYCANCLWYYQGSTIEYDDCFGTIQEREDYIAAIEAAVAVSGYTVNCTRTQAPIIGLDVEICDKKSDVESEVNNLERAGYICKAK